MGLIKWHIIDWTYCSTRSVLNIVKILHSPDCLHSQQWEDISTSRVHQKDARPQRILWRVSSAVLNGTYQLQAVTYGTSLAPCLSTACLKKFTEQEREKYPQATTVLSQDFYMDDVLSGCEMMLKLSSFYHESWMGRTRLRHWVFVGINPHWIN